MEQTIRRQHQLRHIFKLPIGYIQHQQMDLSDSCENEWLCSQIAASIWIASCKM